MTDPTPTEPESAPDASGRLGEKIWDLLTNLRDDLLASVEVSRKCIKYFEAALEKRYAPEAEQRAALEGLLAAKRDIDASPGSSLDQVLSKFLLGLVKAIGREQ